MNALLVPTLPGTMLMRISVGHPCAFRQVVPTRIAQGMVGDVKFLCRICNGGDVTPLQDRNQFVGCSGESFGRRFQFTRPRSHGYRDVGVVD